MYSGRAEDLAHQHDWIPESMTVDFDGELFITYDCSWAEVTGSATSERLDETFYEYGAQCAATKTLVYDVQIVRWEKEAFNGTKEVVDDGEMYRHLYEEEMGKITEEASHVDPFDPMGGFAILGTEVGFGRDYSVEFELQDVRVDEDWE